MSEINLMGVHAKLSRAEQHIRGLADEMDRLCEEVQKGIVREVSDDIDKQIWRYRGRTPQVPVEWSIVIGEVLYNLRSALDHLVWQLVIANGQKPGKRNAFPITTDQKSWQQAKQNGRLQGIAQEHEARIALLQPYFRDTVPPFNASSLETIHDLGNIEKHRHLVITVLASLGPEPMIFGVNQPELSDSSTRPPLKGTGHLAMIESDKVLLEYNNADIPLRPVFRIATQFACEEQRWTRARSVPDVLAECHHTARMSVDFVALGPSSLLFSPKPILG